MKREQLVVVGSRRKQYREYALASLAQRFDLVLVSSSEPGWTKPYISSWVQADTSSPEALTSAIQHFIDRRPGETGLLSWDEWALTAVAAAAAALKLPHLSETAAIACRDKHIARRLWAEAGVPSARSTLVATVDEAKACAEDTGYPVVIKPRNLGGSLGVLLAEDEGQLQVALNVARESSIAEVAAQPGVLVEEYLQGPEVSVDSWVHKGVVHPQVVARKQTGFPPSFEEVGHLVGPWEHEPWAEDLARVCQSAHEALGVDNAVTHLEVRLTARGPRVVELNGRLGGDLIPRLGQLALGVDLPGAAADIAFGRSPTLPKARHRWAAVAFAYPSSDGIVDSIDLTQAKQLPGVIDVLPLAESGNLRELPPKGITPRTAAVLTIGDDAQECEDLARDACQLVVTRMRDDGDK